MSRRRLAVLAALFAGLAAAPAAHARPITDSYRGPGAWVDLYSRRQLAAPEATVRTLAAHGVHTLYLETGNWGNRRAEDVRYPDVAARFITAAHDAGLTVVAWYLPGLRPRDPDLRHCLGAIDFQTADHDGFDGFAMDIESTFIGSIRARDRALLALSARLRDEVGADYPLGAIVPDSRSTALGLPGLWPGFPYRSAARYYDVFLPMAYSVYRGHGPRFDYAYSRYNVALIRQMVGRRVPVHVVGGLAGGLNAAEDRAVVAGARAGGAIGVSFYNVASTGPEEWAALARFR